MKIFKFRIPVRDERVIEVGEVAGGLRTITVEGGVLAVVVEETRDAAAARLKAYLAERGEDARWIKAADIIELEIVPSVVGYANV